MEIGCRFPPVLSGYHAELTSNKIGIFIVSVWKVKLLVDMTTAVLSYMDKDFSILYDYFG